MCLFLSIFILLCAGLQVSVQRNCFREHPRVFDGVFNVFNKHQNPFDVSDQNIADSLRLFSTRFNHAHIIQRGSPEGIFRYGRVASQLAKTSTLDLKVYFSVGTGQITNDMNSTIEILNSTYQAIKEISRLNNSVVKGLYLTSSLLTYEKVLDAYEKVFGSLEKATVDLGEFVFNCQTHFENIWARLLFSKLRFITCHLSPTLQNTPEEAADTIIESCNELRETAKSYNITAEIRCATEYYSQGTSENGIEGSVSGFQRFWCRILERFRLTQSHAKIIMGSAFDATPAALGVTNDNLEDPIYHRGWWKRTKETSYEASAFAEKVESLESNVGINTPDNLGQNKIIMISIISVAVVLLTALVVFLLFKLKSITKNTKLTSEEIRMFKNGIVNSLKSNEEGLEKPYDKTYEIPKSLLQIDTSNTLGYGQQGVIYGGSIVGRNGQVAIKTTRDAASSKSAKDMLSEIKIMCHVGKHGNVLGLIGANTTGIRRGIVYIVTELCELGSLQNTLREEGKINFACDYLQRPRSTETFLYLADKWAGEIACGMEHISSKQVIHGDLAARNVLLTSNAVAKITDFGFSRKLYEYTQYVKQQQEPLPWRWMSPETLRRMVFSSQGDVYSFGITLFELYSQGMLPFPGLAWDFSFMDLVESGFINKQPKLCNSDRFSVMKLCWSVDPANRPSFSELKKLFQQPVLTETNDHMYVNSPDQ